ncbi:hypothetical protein L9F63_009797, partial [Diploptera punctata]
TNNYGNNFFRCLNVGLVVTVIANSHSQSSSLAAAPIEVSSYCLLCNNQQLDRICSTTTELYFIFTKQERPDHSEDRTQILEPEAGLNLVERINSSTFLVEHSINRSENFLTQCTLKRHGIESLAKCVSVVERFNTFAFNVRIAFHLNRVEVQNSHNSLAHYVKNRPGIHSMLRWEIPKILNYEILNYRTQQLDDNDSINLYADPLKLDRIPNNLSYFERPRIRLMYVLLRISNYSRRSSATQPQKYITRNNVPHRQELDRTCSMTTERKTLYILKLPALIENRSDLVKTERQELDLARGVSIQNYRKTCLD